MTLAMRLRWFFIFLINAAFILQVSGQANSKAKGKRMDAQQKEQIQID